MKCNHLQFDKLSANKNSLLILRGFTLYVFKNFFLQSAVTSSLPSRKLRPVTHGKSKTHGKNKKKNITSYDLCCRVWCCGTSPEIFDELNVETNVSSLGIDLKFTLILPFKYDRFQWPLKVYRANIDHYNRLLLQKSVRGTLVRWQTDSHVTSEVVTLFINCLALSPSFFDPPQTHLCRKRC